MSIKHHCVDDATLAIGVTFNPWKQIANLHWVDLLNLTKQLPFQNVPLLNKIDTHKSRGNYPKHCWLYVVYGEDFFGDMRYENRRKLYTYTKYVLLMRIYEIMVVCSEKSENQYSLHLILYCISSHGSVTRIQYNLYSVITYTIGFHQLNISSQLSLWLLLRKSSSS
jgi:hypothetical protein